MKRMRLIVVGAGGHAKVVVDGALAAGWEIAAVVGLPQDPKDVLGYPVVLDTADVDADAFIIAVGRNDIRRDFFQAYAATGLPAATIIHPSAALSPRVEVGAGTFVAAGAIVNVDARIGENVILNTGCTVDHDCVVQAHSLIGPTASLCGGCVVGEGVTMGAGSSAIPRIVIGEWTTVGAGAAVVDHLPPHATAVGVPARVLDREERR